MEGQADINRDKVKNESAFKQKLLFVKLERRCKITPTDVDGLIDYNGNAFLFLEAKKENGIMSYGQSLAYENLIHVLQKGGAPSICVLFRHDTPSNKNIITYNKIVDSIYLFDEEYDDWRWKKPDRQITVLEAINIFEKKCLKNKIKIFKY